MNIEQQRFLIMKSILAGVLIGIGACIYTKCTNQYLGAFLFSFGLLGVLNFEALLFTGKIGYFSFKETKIKDRLYMLIEGLTKTTSRLIAFTDAGNDHIFYMEIVTVDNIYNYDLLEIANDILVNATFNEEVSKIETISVYDVANIAILAAQEYKSRVDNK